MKMVFAGGGTGGHLMVGLSTAEEISSRYHNAQIYFLGRIKALNSGAWSNGAFCFIKSGQNNWANL